MAAKNSPSRSFGERLMTAAFVVLSVFIAANVLGVWDELYLALKQGVQASVEGIGSDEVKDGIASGLENAAQADPGLADALGDAANSAKEAANKVTNLGNTDRFRAALDQLGTLTVKGKAPMTGYSRDAFGPEWSDIDHNGCDTRNDILARDLVNETFKPGTKECVVLAGTLPYDPYTGQTDRQFERGNPLKGLDVEHIVALGNVWTSGGDKWTEAKRTQIANDPDNLIMVDPGQNRAKGDRNAAEWLPQNKDYRCEYVTRQIKVKAKFALAVTEAEKAAMDRVLSGCTN